MIKSNIENTFILTQRWYIFAKLFCVGDLNGFLNVAMLEIREVGQIDS